ncbi:MAG: lipid-A-disaccharide synthase [Bacteroidales bacterium]
MKYYIIAGEASGDLHGSSLMRGLKEADPQAQFRFWGGDLMSAQGGEVVKHYRENSLMGFVEVVGSLKKVLSNLKYCKEDLLQYRPDLLILIDYPGFNFRVAKFAKEHNITTFYYIAPTVWAWKEWRVKNLKRFVDRLFVIFPFELPYFSKHNIEAIYCGNPSTESVEEFLQNEEGEQQFRKRIGADERECVALLPGSRKMEIDYLLPKMVKLQELYPQFQFIVAALPSIEPDLYEKHLKGSKIMVLYNERYSILRYSKFAILASGTASLEAALLGTPQVVCYGGNELSYQIAKRVVKVKYISLVNLILDRGLVEELIQRDYNLKNLKNAVEMIIKERGEKRRERGYSKLKKILGSGEGYSNRLGESMVEEYHSIMEQERYYTTIESPVGELRITSDRENLISIEHAPAGLEPLKSKIEPSILQEAERELQQYFNGERKEFSLPIKPIGTQFQNRVWEELRKIPFGEVKSYGEIAKLVDSPDAHRAVGLACKMNPLLIVIPCHRVIGSNRKLIGFNLGLDKKSYLLTHENANLQERTTTLFDDED